MKTLSKTGVQQWLQKLPDWSLSANGKAIRRSFLMKDFVSAIGFIRKIAEAAEAMDHHPDLHLTGYRHLKIELSTHSLGGLSTNDFVLAGKIEGLPKKLKLSVS